MSEMSADRGQRVLLCVATARYEASQPFPELEGVADEVKVISDWLTDESLGERAFTPEHSELAEGPSRKQLRAAFGFDGDEGDPEPWRPGDAVVVYITGHGFVDGGEHWIALRRTDLNKLGTSAQASHELLRRLYETGVRDLLLIVDTCYSGEAVSRLDRDLPDTWIALGSATRNQQAGVGRVSGAIREFLEDLRSPQGQRYGLAPFLEVNDFISGIQDRLPEGQDLAPLTGKIPRSLASPCLPNPWYRPDAELPVAAARRSVALRPEDLTSHWGPRARGLVDDADPGWLFSGRVELMTKLIAAATGAAGTLVVAGGAGTGKSAALARLVTLSDAGFRAAYSTQVAGIRPEVLPEVGCVDAALLAKGRHPDETLAELIEALGIPGRQAPGVAARGQHLAAVSDWLAAREDLVTLVVDALDESANPRDLITNVLAELARGPGARNLRLLLGVRSPGQDTTAAQQPAQEAGLAQLATEATGGQRINVDDPPWWNPDDLVGYAASVLTRAASSPYPEAGPQATQAVAQAVATHSQKSFLVTRLASMNLAARPNPVDPDDPTWRTVVRDGVVGVFRNDLHAAAASEADRLRAVHLMRALAFSFGRGLPWHQIWPVAATAVADDPNWYGPTQAPPTYGDADIVWLLDSRLAAYLVTDREDGVTVYRMFHQSLTDVLRDQWAELLTGSTP